MPDVLRGVFWMSNNPALELLVVLDGADVQRSPEGVKLRFKLGAPNNWTYNKNCKGCCEWWCVQTYGQLTCSELRFVFDADCKRGRIYLYSCGCVPMTRALCCGARWTMTDISPEGEDGTVWKRGIFIRGVDYGYTGYKIIDKDGRRLPPFDVMMSTLSWEDHPGSPPAGDNGIVKPLTQYVQGSSCVCTPTRKSQVAPEPEVMRRAPG